MMFEGRLTRFERVMTDGVGPARVRFRTRDQRVSDGTFDPINICAAYWGEISTVDWWNTCVFIVGENFKFAKHFFFHQIRNELINLLIIDFKWCSIEELNVKFSNKIFRTGRVSNLFKYKIVPSDFYLKHWKKFVRIIGEIRMNESMKCNDN